MRVVAEISPSGKKIAVSFGFDRDFLRGIKGIAGRKFVPQERGGPYWVVPLDLATARELRKVFGPNLDLGERLTAWGHRQVQQEGQLESLANAVDGELEHLPRKLPELYAAMQNRPWQIPGTKFLATSDAPMNTDEPRMGKTLMELGSVYEANLEQGGHLVICPRTAMESVWAYEVTRWLKTPVYVAGEGSKKQRNDIIAAFVADPAESKWLVIQPSMLKWKDKQAAYPALFKYKFRTVHIDESHKAGIINPKSQTSVGLRKVQADKRSIMSGTPFGGKPVNLWPLLNFLHPERFSSRWAWIGKWLEQTSNGFGTDVGGVRPDRKEEFYKSLAPYMLRRKRKDVRKDIPDDPPVDAWVKLEGEALKQYAQFAADAEVTIDEQNLTATSILAEYTRLKQFSWGLHRLVDGKLLPTLTSPKWEKIVELLEERGVFDGDRDELGNKAEQVVIFSQFRPIVDLVTEELQRRKVKVDKITGEITRKGARAELQSQFQSGDLQVLCMTTTAGGVAITLDRAQTVIMIDETWNPDDQTQAVDRIESMTRDYSIGVYYLRSKGTVEEGIMIANLDKLDVNTAILDARRRNRITRP